MPNATIQMNKDCPSCLQMQQALQRQHAAHQEQGRQLRKLQEENEELKKKFKPKAKRKSK